MLKNQNRLNLLYNSAFSSIKHELYSIIILDHEFHIKQAFFNEKTTHETKEKIEEELNSYNFTEIKNYPPKEIGTHTFSVNSHRFLLSEISDEYSLIVVGSINENVQILFSYTFLLAEKTFRILKDQYISLVIPNLENIPEANVPTPEFVKLSFKAGELSMKVILAGDSAVGKTTLVERYVTEKMNYDYKSTIGLNIMIKEQKYPHWAINVKFSIYDTGGQDQFQKVRENYYKWAKAGFLVFDVTRPDTFHHISRWYAEVKKVEPEIMLILVGNKVDLVEQRKISKKQGKELAQNLGIRYIETTALNKDFVDEAFKTMGFFFILKNRVLGWQNSSNSK